MKEAEREREKALLAIHSSLLASRPRQPTATTVQLYIEFAFLQ